MAGDRSSVGPDYWPARFCRSLSAQYLFNLQNVSMDGRLCRERACSSRSHPVTNLINLAQYRRHHLWWQFSFSNFLRVAGPPYRALAYRTFTAPGRRKPFQRYTRAGHFLMNSKVIINRLATGVPGLDEVLGGGLPEYSFNLIAGPPG